jgi:predicted lipoprotein
MKTISILAFVGLGLVAASIGTAGVADAGPQETVQRLADGFVVPHYRTLVESAAHQRQAWEAFCLARDDPGLHSLRQSYQAVADAWSAIGFVTYGPAGEAFRSERIAFWPDRQNATTKGLATLLKGKGEKGLDSAAMAKASVAAQGLPALQRLVFDDGAAALLMKPEEGRRCALGTAIARNVAATAEDILAGWSTTASPPVPDRTTPDRARDVLTRLVTDFISNLEFVRETKLERTIGMKGEAPRPLLAEGWRSGRTFRAIVVNLTAAEDMAKLFLDDKSGGDLTVVAKIRDARMKAEVLTGNLGEIANDPARRPALLALYDAVTAARDRAVGEVPVALGVTVGFNSRDGD